MNEKEVLEQVYKAFRGVSRPDYFTYHKTDCDECLEYDSLFQSRNVETLTLEEVNRPAGPVSFINPQGFRYYFPALVRLYYEHHDYQVLGVLTFLLTPQENKAETIWMKKKDKKKYLEEFSRRQDKFALFTPAQKEATLAFLKQVRGHNKGYEKPTMLQLELDKLIETWETLAKTET